MVLLKLAIFIFAAYFILKSVVRFLIPPALRNLEKKMKEQNQNYHHNKKEGEVTIQNYTKKNSGINKDIGEYTDFEEIKD